MKVQRSVITKRVERRTEERQKLREGEKESFDMSVDFKKNQAALKAAYNDVLSKSSDVNW